VIDPAKSMLKLGPDVHRDFIMAVVQHAHAPPKAPRKLSRHELLEYVKRVAAEGLQIFCVQARVKVASVPVSRFTPELRGLNQTG
jgi:hypothetical protein